jgi:hypothetical protein
MDAALIAKNMPKRDFAFFEKNSKISHPAQVINHIF